MRKVMDDLLANAATEVVEVLRLAVVRERQHGDRVPVDERRPDRSLDQDWRLASFEHRRVAALRQVDDDVVGATLLAVVVNELRPKAPGLDAHDRIRARIE